MGLSHMVRQAYRLYAGILTIWAAWSVAWILFGLDMASSTVAQGWLVVTAYGGLLVVSLGALRFSTGRSLFQTRENRTRVDRFNNHMLSSAPLHLYVVALAAWSFLTIEWAVMNLGLVGQMILGYGWVLVALYGMGLSLGLVAKHRDHVVAEITDLNASQREV